MTLLHRDHFNHPRMVTTKLLLDNDKSIAWRRAKQAMKAIPSSRLKINVVGTKTKTQQAKREQQRVVHMQAGQAAVALQ